LVGGSLNFNHIWSRYHFTTTYNGGETIGYGFQQNTMYHSLAVSQDIVWQRWRLHLRDNFAASPGAASTGSGMGGPGLIGQFSSTLANSPNTLGQRFQPSETIQTGQAMRYMNAVLGEAEYSSAGGPHLPSLVRMGFCISRMLAISAATCSMRKPAMTTC